MNISLDCIPCIVSNFLKLLKTGILPEDAREPVMRRLLVLLSEADYQQSPPVLGREIHRMVRQELNNPDPYREIKEKYNHMILDMYSDFKRMVISAEDPFDTAMRLAIAGNVIDFGSQYQFEVMETINRVINAHIAIDDSQELKEDLKSAKSLLYIGDNCGEIILDKLFIETIKVTNTYFAVRSGPVINDITIDDAVMVGIDKIAEIITTGDNAPGAVWESTSDDFKQVFNKSDIIISKGQGNLEGLIDVPGNIYFLFVSKCDLIAKWVGANTGDFIVKHSSNSIEQKLNNP
jgi:damage-control phosphatase, subfamily I